MTILTPRVTPLYQKPNGALTPASMNDANMMIMSTPQVWAITDDPALGVAASITRPAEMGRKHVVTSITATLSSTSISSAITKLYLKSGATIIWSASAVVGVNASTLIEALDGVSIAIQEGQAATLEFAFSAGATIQHNVSLTGYTVP